MKKAVFVLAALVLAAGLTGMFETSASITSKTSGVFREVGITSGEPLGIWHVMDGFYNCTIRGAFDGASATFETHPLGDASTIEPIDAPDLVGVTGPTPWVSIRVGPGDYRLSTTGGAGAVDVEIECRKVGNA